jgi:hypothetical protein
VLVLVLESQELPSRSTSTILAPALAAFTEKCWFLCGMRVHGAPYVKNCYTPIVNASAITTYAGSIESVAVFPISVTPIE